MALATAKLEEIVELMPDAIVVVDETSRIVVANSQVEHVFGYGRDELVGGHLQQLVPRRFRAAHAIHEGRYAREPEARSMGKRNVALFGVRKDGGEFPAEISLSTLETESGRLVIAAVRDITQRVVAESVATDEAHRRAIMEAMLEAEEGERARIASALHDDTIQVMTASLIALERALNTGREPDDLRAVVATARDTIREAAERTRRLMFELQPAVLYEQGIAAAIAPLVENASRDIGADWSLNVSPERFARPVEELVYRTVREAITNVRKHSEASQVSVTASPYDAKLAGVVTDNGRGFAMDQLRQHPRRSHHIGLATMVERVRMAGGEIRVDSEPGAGTQIAFAVPLEYHVTHR